MAYEALRLLSTSSMGWDPQTDRPSRYEVDERQAEEWRDAAQALLQRARRCLIKDPSKKSEGDASYQAIEVLMAPINLAKDLGVSLWSDERPVRQLARSEGVAAFSTEGLLRALLEAGRLGNLQYSTAIASMLRGQFADLDFTTREFAAAAASEDWTGETVGQALSRVSVWQDPRLGLALYATAVREALAYDASLLTTWAAAAAVGSARARDCSSIAPLFAYAISATQFEFEGGCSCARRSACRCGTRRMRRPSAIIRGCPRKGATTATARRSSCKCLLPRDLRSGD